MGLGGEALIRPIRAADAIPTHRAEGGPIHGIAEVRLIFVFKFCAVARKCRDYVNISLLVARFFLRSYKNLKRRAIKVSG